MGSTHRVGWAKAAKTSPYWHGVRSAVPTRHASAKQKFALCRVGTADPARCVKQSFGAAFAHPTRLFPGCGAHGEKRRYDGARGASFQR
jgi:hypothetical protein